jgi:H+/gluconate symporter-like permease
MKKIAVGIIALSLSLPVMAENHFNMPIKTRDHMLIGAGIGSAVDIATGSSAAGALTTCGLSAAKLVVDKASTNGKPEIADAGFTCLAGAIGAVGIHALYFDTFHGTPMLGVNYNW